MLDNAGGDGAYFQIDMSDALPSEITAEIVQLRMKIFLRSPLRRRLLARQMRLLDKVGGQQVMEMSGDESLSVASMARPCGLVTRSTACSSSG